jgi:hypothetical protein
MTMDKMLYLIVCNDKGQQYVPERELSDMDSKSTLASIAAGEWTDLCSVLVFNPAEHICTDVTAEFVVATCNLWADSGEPLQDWQRTFIELHMGVSAAHSFAQAAE